MMMTLWDSQSPWRTWCRIEAVDCLLVLGGGQKVESGGNGEWLEKENAEIEGVFTHDQPHAPWCHLDHTLRSYRRAWWPTECCSRLRRRETVWWRE